jgi:hypothetical protein
VTKEREGIYGRRSLPFIQLPHPLLILSRSLHFPSLCIMALYLLIYWGAESGLKTFPPFSSRESRSVFCSLSFALGLKTRERRFALFSSNNAINLVFN